MSKFLVTGGAGFIGSNLVKELVKNGEEVLVVVEDLSTGHLDNLKEVRDKVEFIQASSGDCLQLEQAKGLKGIFHLGMPSSSPIYRENHYLVGKSVNDFIAILDLAKRENCKLVFASSSSLYNGNTIPYKEDMPVLVKDFYSEARYFMERLAWLYNDFWQTEFIGLRLLSVYGPGEKNKKHLANMVSQILWWIQDNKQPVLYGDGEQTRDFVYVKDVVRAFILAMDSKIKADIFNVGAGKSHSLNQAVKIINDVLGKSIAPTYLANPVHNYVDVHLADTTKAETVLGFKAQYSLEQGIKDIIEDEQNQGENN